MDKNRRDASIEKDHLIPTRRHLLQSAGGLVVASALPANGAVGATLPAEGAPKPTATAAPDLTGRLASYMIAARDRSLPSNALLDAKHRVLVPFHRDYDSLTG
jgi:hypothetical protein